MDRNPYPITDLDTGPGRIGGREDPRFATKTWKK